MVITSEFTDKQLKIMESAENLFAEKGFNGTSVREIADKANINLAMVSYYFGSKEKLLEAIFNYRGESIKLKLESIIQQPGLSSLEKVNMLVDHYIEKIINRQSFHRILAREQVLNNTGPIADLILEMKKRNLEIISRLIQEGQEKGEFIEQVDVPMMMTMMVGTASHLITSKQYYKELSNLQSLNEEEYLQYISEKLSHHLKFLLKSILTHAT
jgi:AcrR family transcriptional regulator